MEATSTIERRRSLRIPFTVPAKILLPELPVIPVRTIEISLGGIGLVSEAQIAPNNACAVAFELQTLHERRRINVWGMVTHTSKLPGNLYRSGIAIVDADPISRHFLRIFLEELSRT
ncbi:PilZ domain-containing protein [Noviherbaspirillum aerium]|uniref:PilZ domain-containing protein n=1 Tax=Noviherbaspirillum aerium TaxID=2588497 RepID=UPI00124C42E4|nr:PilZ domain-containing protein [Noviherbaspirillum aerium]